MIRTISFQSNLYRSAIGKNHRGVQKHFQSCAADTETVNGQPFSIQFSFDGTMDNAEVLFVNNRDALSTFLSRLGQWAKRKHSNVCWFHNLGYDWQVLLQGQHERRFLDPRKIFTVWHDGCKIRTWSNKTWLAEVKFPNGRNVHIRDTMTFLEDSLEGAAITCGSPVTKAERPKCQLEDRQPTPSEMPGFLDYAKRDPVMTWHIAEQILDHHKKHDIMLSVSMAHSWSRIFRHRYLKPSDTIQRPKPWMLDAATLSFHGGKVALHAGRKPGWYKKTWELDVNGAYAFAMRNLPNPLAGDYRTVRENPGPGAHGLLCITGSTNDKYGIIFDHRGRAIRGKFQRTWATTYEVEEGLKSRTLHLSSVFGFVYESRTETRNPFRSFVDDCWKAKEQAPDPSFARVAAKAGPNTVYGKMWSAYSEGEMAQRTPGGDIVMVKQYRPSQMWHPFFASLITGRVRALIHHYERKYEAIHTATDAIKTQMAPDPADITPELGKLKVAAYGRCLILAPRLCYHEDPKAPKPSFHNFHADLKTLLKVAGIVLRGKTATYLGRKSYSLREKLRSTKKDIVALKIMRTPMKLRPYVSTF